MIGSDEIKKHYGATPSKRAKSLGVKNLVTLSDKTGVPVSTLKDWSKTKPETFDKLCNLVRIASQQ